MTTAQRSWTRINVTPSIIHYHFPNKQALMRAALEW